jgi:hypothetical protein
MLNFFERRNLMPKSLKENLPKNISKDDQKYVEKFGDKLSDSTQYAQWISGPDDHEDHPGASLVTRNHDVIMRWAEERGGWPATVEGTEHGNTLGVLRFDFEGGSDRLKHVTWNEWFKAFDERDLVFIYQEHKKDGNQSNFFRLDNPNREDG